MTINLDMNRTATLTDLVARLEERGVNVPGVARWRELTDLTREELSDPKVPADLLSQTVEQMRAWADARALHSSLRIPAGRFGSTPRGAAMEVLAEDLGPALKERIRANAVDIIDQLRPEFDEAAILLRHARDLGVGASDTESTLFHSSDEKRNAWTAAKRTAPVLDGIFETRQMLSTVAGVPPTLEFQIGRQQANDVRNTNRPSGFNWSAVLIAPEVVGTVSLATKDHDAPWARWLDLAPYLQLAYPVEEKNDAAHFLRTTGMTPEQALAQSQGQGERLLAEVAAANTRN